MLTISCHLGSISSGILTRPSISFTSSGQLYDGFAPLLLGVMKLEATKFRPREVVKHVLQTAAASLRKFLVLEGRIADDVPIEVRVIDEY